MRRFGSTGAVPRPAGLGPGPAPEAGARSNFIVGFPVRPAADVAELERFLTEARLDAIGVFDYSDEDGTEAATVSRQGFTGDHQAPVRPAVRALADELCAQRAEDRIGSTVDVLVEHRRRRDDRGRRRAHQAPEVDGSSTTLVGDDAALRPRRPGPRCSRARVST